MFYIVANKATNKIRREHFNSDFYLLTNGKTHHIIKQKQKIQKERERGEKYKCLIVIVVVVVVITATGRGEYALANTFDHAVLALVE